MSVTACAQIVEKGNPDRFLAVMAAPVEMRPRLWPLYALNVEAARAPWVTEEAGIAEIRLQWWRDALSEIAAGDAVRRHEVVEPLAEVVRDQGLTVETLDVMIAARRWDIYREAFEDAGHFTEHMEQTAGGLMVLACEAAMGAVNVPPAVRTQAMQVGYVSGVANWLMAVPELEARGRVPLVDGTHAGLKTLAREALTRLDVAGRVDMGDAAPVLRSAWRARGILQQVVRDPAAVAEGRLGGSEFSRRAGLAWKAMRGGW